jgi:transposase-like protein
LRLKIRDEGTVKNKAVYLALGIRTDGRKEVVSSTLKMALPHFV